MRTSTFSYIYITVLFAMATIFSSCNSSLTDSNSNQLSNSNLEGNTEVVTAMSGSAAFGFFEILDTGNSSASGSVTVTYLGEQVTTNYSSTWTTFDVAATIASNINNDNDIQLYATIPDYSKPEIRIRERRTGSQ